MSRRTAIALALAAALAGCPLPQPLPEYRQGQTVTPPRILADGIAVDQVPSSSRAVILVPAGCPPAKEPSYALSARIHDTNTIEQVEARWFVNYAVPPSLDVYSTVWREDTIPPNADPLDLVRNVPPNDADGFPQPWVFKPYQYLPAQSAPQCAPALPCGDANVLRVVELVVSNGFFPSASEPPAVPNRTPMLGFETQVYRWVFLTVPAKAANDPCEPATDPTCVKCPP